MGRKKKLSALDTVKALATTEEKKSSKKSSIPVVEMSLEVTQAIDDYVQADADEKDAKARLEAAREVIIPEASKAYQAVIEDKNAFLSSITMNGELMYTSQCRYSAVPEEVVEALQE
jgi:hypothetical protein